MFPGNDDAETAAELHRRYVAALNRVVDEVGEARVRTDAGLDPSTIEAIRDGATDVELEDVARVMALEENRSRSADAGPIPGGSRIGDGTAVSVRRAPTAGRITAPHLTAGWSDVTMLAPISNRRPQRGTTNRARM
jgi:hypothetical protein